MQHNISIENTVGYTLASVCRLHRQRANELMKEIGLHVGQEMLLSALCKAEGMTQTELAECLMIQAATVTNSLRRLERDGIVERNTDLEDKRISRVYLTDKGRELINLVEEKWKKLEEQTFNNLSPEERILLRRLLLQAYQNLSRTA